MTMWSDFVSVALASDVAFALVVAMAIVEPIAVAVAIVARSARAAWHYSRPRDRPTEIIVRQENP